MAMRLKFNQLHINLDWKVILDVDIVPETYTSIQILAVRLFIARK